MLSHIINFATFKKGYRTFLVSLIIAIGPDLLNWIGHVDFTTIGLSSNAAKVIALIIAGMRYVTTTGPLNSNPKSPN